MEDTIHIVKRYRLLDCEHLNGAESFFFTLTNSVLCENQVQTELKVFVQDTSLTQSL